MVPPTYCKLVTDQLFAVPAPRVWNLLSLGSCPWQPLPTFSNRLKTHQLFYLEFIPYPSRQDLLEMNFNLTPVFILCNGLIVDAVLWPRRMSPGEDHEMIHPQNERAGQPLILIVIFISLVSLFYPRVRTFPKESHLSHDTVRALMYYALKIWSDITPLNFHEVAGNNADIQIDFSKADHNDGYPFDGPGGTVAHAFFPGDHHTAGDTHFDDDEYWTFRSSGTSDIYVSVMGTLWGLGSSAHPSWPQRPLFAPLCPQRPVTCLSIRVSNQGGNLLSFCRLRRDMPNRCNTHFDAVAQIRGEAFFFKGKYFWRLTRNKHLVSLQPAQIHRFWRGLPLNMNSVDAVYERTNDHKIVFFKGDRYWVFKDNNVEEGYPRPISDFGLPPGGIDAAFSWAHNDKTYFFKDSLYWRYDDHERRMDPGYPSETTLWKGIPSTLDDAMRWSDGATYFFRGKEYWKVLDNDLEAEPGYPQSIARDWLVCGDMQSDSPDSSGSSRTGARSNQGQRDESRSENGYEVCSCTSSSSDSLSARLALRLLASLVLASVWTAAVACAAL
uniref:Matrix metallopeptidase 17 n=1 Tax=Gopherus evgoodei TaxID=1825980 RepID=A0A8C4YT63_9SAUR